MKIVYKNVRMGSGENYTVINLIVYTVHYYNQDA